MKKELIRFTDCCGHSRLGIYKKCPICEKEFFTRYDRPAKTCGPVCGKRTRRKHIILICAGCKKEFQKTPSKMTNSKSKLYFCTRKCKDKAQRIGGIKEIQPPHYGTGIPDYRKKFDEKDMKCLRCGYKEFICSVQIHHIDKNRRNNEIKNLLPLCANCHMALHYNYWKLEEIKGYKFEGDFSALQVESGGSVTHIVQ